ncbi:Protein ACCELERATED CELL DEATH like [Actinidia chinensis var. chinensis]|uniref:Protein ACCELERATED CELL DEATH like n=1 Tax=Actinidia chinensis var. chinensis TaxID=1590841 RepID=A0A2R6QPK2_ACTCC|nr:Protein ACCELERATED CELL DEATH like [Actinidia chinensis var. chinensis]
MNMANPPQNTSKNWFKYFQYQEGRDSPGDARNMLLVIATLIAGVTFQAGVSPPGGVWQDGDKAGRAIYASDKEAFYVFMISNTLALSTSVLVIISLTIGFPFHFEIMVAMISMIVTYASSVFAVTKGGATKFRYVLLTVLVPFLLRGSIHMFRKLRSM